MLSRRFRRCSPLLFADSGYVVFQCRVVHAFMIVSDTTRERAAAFHSRGTAAAKGVRLKPSGEHPSCTVARSNASLWPDSFDLVRGSPVGFFGETYLSDM